MENDNNRILRKRLFAILTCLVIVSAAVAASLYIRRYRTEAAYEQEGFVQTIQAYAGYIETSMKRIEDMLIAQSTDTVLIQNILKPADDLNRYVSYEKQKLKFDSEIQKYAYLGGMNMYDYANHVYIGTSGAGVSGNEHTDVKNHIKKVIAKFRGQGSDNQWIPVSVDGTYYLFYTINIQSLYYSAWMKADHLVEELVKKGRGEDDKYFVAYPAPRKADPNNMEAAVILSSNAEEITWEDSGNAAISGSQYDVYSGSVKNNLIQIVHLKRDYSRKKYIENLVFPFFLITALALSIYLLIIYITREKVLKPYDAIILEKELKRQHAELQFLQKQVSPHFLSNCLSLVRNLIFLKKYDEAEKATVILGKYIRGSLNPQTEITLQEELQNVEAYCNLQRMRYDDRIVLDLQADETLLQALVPSMIIQTFTSNCIKHQMERNSVLKIRVQIYTHFEKIYIIVTGTGKEFPPDILKKVRQGQEIIDEEGIAHIGISNMMHRMEMLYGDDMEINIGNQRQGGVYVRMKIPLRKSAGQSQVEGTGL